MVTRDQSAIWLNITIPNGVVYIRLYIDHLYIIYRSLFFISPTLVLLLVVLTGPPRG